MKSKFIILRFL